MAREALNPNDVVFTDDDFKKFMPPEGHYYRVKLKFVEFYRRDADASWMPNKRELSLMYVFLPNQDEGTVMVNGESVSLSDYCAGNSISENVIAEGGGDLVKDYVSRCRTFGKNERDAADVKSAVGWEGMLTVKHKAGKTKDGEDTTFLNVRGVFNMQ